VSEETPRRGRRRGPGILSALAGATLLVAVGFALGVVGGLVLEEPGLLVDYVTGRTTAVAVDGETPAPDVAASPPPAAEPALPEARVASEPTSLEPAPPAVAEPDPRLAMAARSEAPARGFAVQVGAFADAGAAEQLARRLRARGLPVYLAPSTGADPRWRVRVGPLPSRAEAEQMAKRLEQEERLGTWVLAESPI
jgi:cell division septation protein DedD